MLTLQSPTIVRFKGSTKEYAVIKIDGRYARLTPMSPSYGNQGDFMISPDDYEWADLEVVTQGTTLTDEEEVLD